MSEDVTWRTIAFYNRKKVDGEKTIFQRDNAIVLMNYYDDLREILARKIYDQERPPIENVVEFEEIVISTWTDIQNQTINQLVDCVRNKLTEVIKNIEESLIIKWKRKRINIEFIFFLQKKKTEF